MEDKYGLHNFYDYKSGSALRSLTVYADIGGRPPPPSA
jgi:hypothetical protein